jgi:prepilin-type N-terminal cleavage/methylation domain-containing protein
LKRYRKKRILNIYGFTFLEVLAALAILSAALIPILTWVPTSIQTKLKTERKTTAIFLAQAKIEELHYKIIKNFDKDYNAGPLAFDSPYQDFRYTLTVNNVTSDLKKTSARVWHIEEPTHENVFYTQVARR